MKAYSSQNGMFGYYNESYFIKCGYDIFVKAVLKNFDTGNVTLIVEFIVAGEVTMANLSFNDMKDVLNEKGYAVSYDNERHIKAYLHQQVDATNSIPIYDNLGWCKTKSGMIFKGDTLYNTNWKMAIYRGSYDIKPRGVKEDFAKDLQDVIIGNTPLETAVVIGLSACVIGYMSNFTTIDTMICNIYGRSTTGKTSAAKLAVSMGGNIDCGKSKQSLVRNCSATKNALLGCLADNNGYPILFDELGRLDKTVDLSQLIYSIADGTDKARMNKSGTIKKAGNWATAVMFTGEVPLLDSRSAPKGAEIRVMSFPYVKWTKNERQAESVEKFSKKYSGLGIKLLAEDIINEEKDFNLLYEKYANELKESVPVEKAYKARVAKHIAILKLTAELASHAFGISFNTKKIIDFIYDNLKKQGEITVWKEAYEYIVGCIYKNLRNFISDCPEPCMHHISGHSGATFAAKVPHMNTYGYIKYTDDDEDYYLADCCVVTTTIFNSWMEKGKFTDITAILREWREHNLLKTKDKTHLKSKKIISPSGSFVSCYVINLENCNVKLPKKSSKSDEIPLPEYEQVTTAQYISTSNEDVEGVENPC